MSFDIMGDDLSGVLEAGAAFRAQGWRVLLPLDGAEVPDEPGVIRLVTTESRNLGASEAASRVRMAARQGRKSGRNLVFKKIDSTLRGPVGAEINAIMTELAPPLVVLCPANPSAGRTIRNGMLRVDGLPLAQTDFRYDPHWPARESSVREHLRSQGVVLAGELDLSTLRHHAADGLRRQRAAGSVILSDAEGMHDLLLLVRAVLEVEPSALFVGSGALATVLAREHALSGGPPLIRPEVRPLLVLSGTRHPTTRRQLERLACSSGVQIHHYCVGRDDLRMATEAAITAIREHSLAIVRLDAEGPPCAAKSTRLLTGASSLAIEVDAQIHPKAWFVTGGETAWQVCQALRGTMLEVLCELEPGVVASTLRRHPSAPCTLITKPGGFGNDETLNRIHGIT